MSTSWISVIVIVINVVNCFLMKDNESDPPDKLTNHCGFFMENGTISQSCVGYYTIKEAATTTIHQCFKKNLRVYHTAIEVFVGDCSTVLLNYSPRMAGTPLILYPIVYLTIISTLLLILAVLCMWMILRARLRIVHSDKIEVMRKGVSIQDETSLRSFSWCQVFLISLCCKQVTAGCVSPLSVIHFNESSHFTFTLNEGDMACFTTGTIEHTRSTSILELAELYVTTHWTDHVWSATRCGTTGGCGKVSECGYWGEHGKLRWRDSMMYKKVCRPHERSFFVCPSLWGCWLATLEVSWGDPYHAHTVSEIGVTQTDDDFVSYGLDECTINQENISPINFKGLFLVHTNHSDAWLCEKVRKEPKAGHIGDLQFPLDGSKPDFDFDAFKCEFAAADSTGSCTVRNSALKTSLEDCLKLPSLTDQGMMNFEQSELKVHGGSGKNFKVTCPRSVSLRELSHDCYSLEASLHGVRGDGHLSYLALSASSHNSEASITFESSCGGPGIVLPCDGRQRAYPITSEDYSRCYSKLPIPRDERTQAHEIGWHWDDGFNAYGYFNHFNLSITTCIILVIVAIMLLRCIVR
nr:MAG: glycoprotein [Coquillettidia bunyavirus]